MSSPRRVEWDLNGQTVWGQRVKLVFERGYEGKRYFSLVQEASSQRDETTILRGLTREVLAEAAEVAKDFRG